MADRVRVLVLEDDVGMRDMIATVLTQEGYQVEAVGRGAEAVQLASTNPFDLVIADIRMEGMDGLEALRRVREHQPDVRSLVVTGYSTEDDSIRAIRLGVGDYLRKPFDFKEFLGSVRRLVSTHRQEAARRELEQRLRASWMRSAEALAGLLDNLGHPGRPARGLVASADLAVKLADGLGLGRESQEIARLAVLVAGVSGLEGVPFQPAAEELPAGLSIVIRHLEEWFDGRGPSGLQGDQIPIESRIASVALLDERPEGRCDPRVLEALEQTSRQRPPDPSRHLRGLLSLGRALEEARDAEGARQAYAEIVLARHLGAETIEAHLGLARLARDPQEAAAEARRAAAQATQATPATAAAAYLKAGQILKDASLLEQAAKLSRDLGQPAGEARALLAARVLARAPVPDGVWQRALAVLSAPENAWELAGCAPWLLSFLLEQGAERALVQLARDVPREFERQLPNFPPASRAAGARALAHGGGMIAERVLERLAADPDQEVRSVVAGLRRTASQGPPVLRIFTLGPLEVFRGEDRVSDKAWRSQKGKYLFAFLAAHKGQPVSEDVLIDAFWPDEADKGRRNLYWYCSTLRAGLRPEGYGEELDYIQRSGGTLRLNPELPRWHDLELFDELSDQGLKGEDLDRLRRAVALYRGPFLESCYMDWTDPVRDRASTRLQECLTVLLRRSVAEGRFQESFEHAQRLLQLDPCCQDAYEGAILAQLNLGRPEQAVRLFERCQKLLSEELGIEPTTRLLELHQRARLSLA